MNVIEIRITCLNRKISVGFPNGKVISDISLQTPDEIYIAGSKTLRNELRWYLEDYISNPFGAYTERAERITAKLREWGTECYKQLFENEIISSAKIVIQSESSTILAFPWEALYDGEYYLAQKNIIERQIVLAEKNFDPTELIFHNAIKNILLVISRPMAEKDVQYLNIARPLTDLLDEEVISINIDLLRPPTLSALERTVNAKRYDIILFDCHGGYNEDMQSGFLVLETDDGSIDCVLADEISKVLKEKNIPIVILNACRSAMTSVDNAFASVATALIRDGIKNVIAMGYNLHIQGAEYFISTFFKELSFTGDIGKAVLCGRNKLFLENKRRHITGEYELNDWLIPVLYGEAITNFTLKSLSQKKKESSLPNEVPKIEGKFVGRDDAIFNLERALRQDKAAILIHGMMGVGKTTLAIAFLNWLEITNGLGLDVFWFNFESIRSSEYVFNTLGDRILGKRYRSLDTDEKFHRLVQEMKSHKYIVVWDNFESASGISGTAIIPHMPREDYNALKSFLSSLRYGKSKLIITSRKSEELSDIYTYRLDELADYELAAFCNLVLQKTRFVMTEENYLDYLGLLKNLGGNPLILGAILPKLTDASPKELALSIERELANGNTDSSSRIRAALSVVFGGIDKRYTPVLTILGIHERCFEKDTIKCIFKCCGYRKTDERVDACIAILTSAGFCHALSEMIYELHPAVRAYLSVHYPSTDKEEISFAKQYEEFSFCFGEALRAQHDHEFGSVFSTCIAEFYKAMKLAEKHRLYEEFFSIANTLEIYQYNIKNMSEALQLIQMILYASEKYKMPQQALFAYHEMGDIALDECDYDKAEKYYLTALDKARSCGKVSDFGDIYFQLGRVFEERLKFDEAERYYGISLSSDEILKNKFRIAMVYYQLGIVNEKRPNYEQARKYYRDALKICRALKDDYWIGNLLYLLGNLEFDIGHMGMAWSLYRRAHEKAKLLHSDNLLALIYRQFGSLNHEEGNLAESERCYRNSLAITEREGDEFSSAATYNNLAIIAEESRDYPLCISWYRKAIPLFEKYHDEQSLMDSCFQYANALIELRKFSIAKRMLNKALELYKKHDKAHKIGEVYCSFATINEETENYETARDYCDLALEIFEELNDEYWVSVILHEIGMIETGKGNLNDAQDYCKKALFIQKRLRNRENLAAGYQQLGKIYYLKYSFKEAERWTKKSLVIETKLNNIHGMAQSYYQLGLIAEDIGEYDKAAEFLRIALSHFQHLDDRFNIAETNYELGDIYLEKDELSHAEESYKFALTIYKEIEIEQGIADSLNGLGVVCHRSGDDSNAEKYYVAALTLFNKLGDSESAKIVRENLREINSTNSRATEYSD